jgi:two-component system cell cycle sensor histidine kinase/response regulator CckA
VLWAANGEEALEILAEIGETIQLAVLDLQMPRIGGLEVFERARVRHPELRFIFSTGYNPDTAQLDPLRALSVEFLPKPYGLQALAQAVRRVLER